MAPRAHPGAGGASVVAQDVSAGAGQAAVEVEEIGTSDRALRIGPHFGSEVRRERRDIRLDDRPEDVEIDGVVAVDRPAGQAHDLLPGHGRRHGARFLRTRVAASPRISSLQPEVGAEHGAVLRRPPAPAAAAG